MFKLYWVSVITQTEYDTKPWLCSMESAETSFDRAMETVNRLRRKHIILSAWIDVYDENDVKQTVFHECYIDSFGNIKM